MSRENLRSSFWSWGISGLIGAAIGAGGIFFSQKQADTVENQYYMELDQLRHSALLTENVSFEEKLQDLRLLQEVRMHGFRPIFEQNLQRDIAEIETSIAKIEQARKESETAAANARKQEEERAAAAAQERKEQAVRTNPLIFENCGRGTNRICP